LNFNNPFGVVATNFTNHYILTRLGFVIHFSVQNMGIQRYTPNRPVHHWDIIFVVVPVKLHVSENCSFFQTRRFQGSFSHVSN
jgi:hypothetical protein